MQLLAYMAENLQYDDAKKCVLAQFRNNNGLVLQTNAALWLSLSFDASSFLALARSSLPNMANNVFCPL